MPKAIRRLWIWAVFGSFAAANAQTAAPPPAMTQFDGTYAFVSATKLNESWTGQFGRIRRCSDVNNRPPIVIVNGEVRYLTGWTGTVGSKGELTMQFVPPSGGSHSSVTYEITITGQIDGSGTIRAHRSAYGCNYDFVWRKLPQ